MAVKYWPIAMLSILIVAVLCTSRYAENRKAEQHENTQASGPKDAVAPNSTSQSGQNASKPHHHPEWIDTFAWPDGVTAWALLLTLIVIGWQSTETRDAAKGALLNAQAVIDAERAWVIIRSSMNWGYIPFVSFPLKYWWEIENVSNTPAQILETQCRYELIRHERLYTLPEVPVYPEPIDFAGRLLPPKGKEDFTTFCNDEVGQIIKDPPDQTEINSIKNGLCFLRAYGYVRYRDGFGNERESRFCDYYVWPQDERRGSGFRPLIGIPSAYNECT